jgi:hypothetical protein
MTEDKMKLCLITTIVNSPEIQALHGQELHKREAELLALKFRPDEGVNVEVDKEGFILQREDETRDEFLKRLCDLCGNIAVSRYNPDVTYNFIERLHYCGAKQINMHVFVSEETYDDALKAFGDSINDKRLKYLTSIVLLFLKQKGRGQTYSKLSDEKFNQLFNIAIDNDIRFGFDICCSHRFMNFIEKYHDQSEKHIDVFDVCDSGRFSCYINSLGEYCPCSFIEDDGIWLNGPSVLKCHNFIKEIWNGELSNLYKTMLLSNNNSCIYYDV